MPTISPESTVWIRSSVLKITGSPSFAPGLAAGAS
jgi:hypothetical protein